ncbi:MAG TPA: hypothetical protein VFV50_19690 [Bdellovibrionales bacterium]|nr:hypothetical protein [Bdellovibrionales bacterium]
MLFLIVLFMGPAAAADFNFGGEAGLGLTDNANLEDSQRDGDFYVRIAGQVSSRKGEHAYGARLGLTDYLREHSNDVVSWRLYDRWQKNPSAWLIYAALLGQDYTGGDSGITDSSFDNFGFDAYGEKTKELGSRTSLGFGPGLAGRYYTSLSNRSDHTLYGFAEIDHELSQKVLLGGRTELGFLISNDADFSRTYLELSGNIDYLFRESWNWFSELTIRQTSFTSRTASEETIVSRRRGRMARAETVTELEAHSSLMIYTEVVKKHSSTIETGASLRHSNQSSRSGYQNYSANELYGRIVLSF